MSAGLSRGSVRAVWFVAMLACGCSRPDASMQGAIGAGQGGAAMNAGAGGAAGSAGATTSGAGGMSGGTAGMIAGAGGLGGAGGSSATGGAGGLGGTGGATDGSGGTSGGSSSDAGVDADAGSDEESCELPNAFAWTSSGVLVSPKSDASHQLVSVKDPTIVFHDDRYQVYATTASTAGNWSMVHFSFDDFDEASEAPHYYMDATPGFTGYHCAPNLFYFEPDGLWYLIQQSQPPQYSTSEDPTDPSSWTPPQYFYPGGAHLPSGAPSLPIDYWVICDDAKCHLFFTGDNGRLYRAETSIDAFPSGFGGIETVLMEGQFELFEGSAHYKVKGRDQYLTLIEAIGSGGRFYRSWTASSLEGPWTPLAATEAEPFAGRENVAYDDDWTDDVSHGELIRDGVDQTMTIDACDLRLLYQGRDPSSGGEYSQLPYRLGLLTLDR
jgi:hypothetical protein